MAEAATEGQAAYAKAGGIAEEVQYAHERMIGLFSLRMGMNHGTQAFHHILNVYSQVLGLIRIVVAFGGQPHEIARYAKALEGKLGSFRTTTSLK